MQSITFECEVITPMFLAGADGSTPELRPPSIKGALRFWWRALNGHLVENGNFDRLREIEGKIFGDTSCRSSFSVKYQKVSYEEKKEKLLPHKTDSKFRRSAIVNDTFSITFSSKSEETLNFIANLFKLTTIIGGFGARSRRGFGSVSIVNQDLDYTLEGINTLVKLINPNFILRASNQYPTVVSFEISQNTIDLVQIGNATHETKYRTDKSRNKENYNATVGAGSPRFASPIYISVLPNNKAIITTLTAKSPDISKYQLNLQTDLKRRIL